MTKMNYKYLKNNNKKVNKIQINNKKLFKKF